MKSLLLKDIITWDLPHTAGGRLPFLTAYAIPVESAVWVFFRFPHFRFRSCGVEQTVRMATVKVYLAIFLFNLGLSHVKGTFYCC